MKTTEEVGKALRAIRMRHGKSQKDVAVGIGTTRAVISRWERGEVAATSTGLIEFLRFLNSNLAELHREMEGPTDVARLLATALSTLEELERRL